MADAILFSAADLPTLISLQFCTRQMIQGENFRNWLKNRKSFPVYGVRYMVDTYVASLPE